MKQLIKTIEQTNPKLLFWLIVGTSIVLAAWMQHIQHGWINPDSVLYLEAAKRIVINDFKGAYQIFNWPFYAFCIGTVSKITHLNVHVSAQFLNMIFFAITTASFLNIIRLAGGKNLALFAGALLLFSNTYIVGDVLEMLMRDEGFWAFYLTSILYFIKHHENGQTRHAILWQASAILALLFRIEGLVYLLVLPLIHLFNHQISHKRRLENILNTYSISLIALLIILISVNTIDSLSMSNFGRLKEVFNTDLWLSFSRNFREKHS
ncbi:MAG: glycosyltransferase family 39 protein [Methylophilaceae bacterium]|nr:glycosyltransferase family 39 protein [Methylophilaceae bacterium]